MRRIRTALVVVAMAALGIITVPTPAQGHGTCTAFAGSVQVSPGQVIGSGNYDCHGTNHTMFLSMYIQRRTPGQSWQTIAQNTSGPAAGTDFITGGVTASGFNCAKDYRARAVGSAETGGHLSKDNGPVRTHTC